MKYFETSRSLRAMLYGGRLLLLVALVGCASENKAESDTETESASDSVQEEDAGQAADAGKDTESDAEEGRFTDTDTGFKNDAGVVYPGVNWPKIDPESAGLDAEILEEAAAFADDKDSHCFVVTRGGRLAAEWYFDGWNPDTESNVYSATKSIVSLVVGAAETEGVLSIDDPASDYVTDWQGTDSEDVLIRQILDHTSGRYWEFNSDYLSLNMASDKTDFALGVGQAEAPGTYWEYNNTAVQTLDGVLQVAFGRPVYEYATEKLFKPIGATSFFALDGADNTVTYSDLNASCRDLARFGYLLLRDGVWGDETLIDAGYLEALAVPSELNASYGYLWWLNRDGHWVAPAVGEDAVRIEGDGKMLTDVPEDIVFARGYQGQLIAVDKAHELVFTRIGGEPDPVAAFLGGIDPSDDAFIQGILPLVLSAVVEE